MIGHNLSRARPVLPGTSTPAAHPLPPARIYEAAPASTSSGRGQRRWVLEFETSAPTSLDPLMGWTVTSDPLSQVRMTFPDMQSAIGFAERKGWRYVVGEPSSRPLRARSRLRNPPPQWPFRAVASSEEAPAPSTAPDDLELVDEALLETFPASDPPAWTLGWGRDRRQQPTAA